MKTAVVLIDNMYLQNAADAFNVKKVDIPKFSRHVLENSEELFRTYVFDALPYLPENPTEDQQKRRKKKEGYFNRLKFEERVIVEEGYVKGKDVKCRKCNKWFKIPIQKAVDVKISVKLVEFALSKSVDIIVLVSAFLSLVER